MQPSVGVSSVRICVVAVLGVVLGVALPLSIFYVANPWLREILSPISRPHPESAAPDLKPSPKDTYHFLVQIEAFRDPASSAALAKKMKQKGYPVMVRKGGGLERVSVGPFPTERDAARVCAELEKHGYRPMMRRTVK